MFVPEENVGKGDLKRWTAKDSEKAFARTGVMGRWSLKNNNDQEHHKQRNNCCLEERKKLEPSVTVLETA